MFKYLLKILVLLLLMSLQRALAFFYEKLGYVVDFDRTGYNQNSRKTPIYNSSMI